MVVITCLFEGQAGPVSWTAIPRSVSWRRNNVRQADTARVTLSYRDFPVDARFLRSAQVSIHAADVPGGGLLVPSRGNLRFIGVVDEPETNWGPEGEFVNLTCRDFTAIYLGFRWEQREVVLYQQTMLQVVNQIREQVTPELDLVQFIGAALPIASKLPADVAATRILATDKRDTAWDVLTKVCEIFALVPAFDLDVLVIRTPGESSAGEATFVYGENVQRVKFRRNLTARGAQKRVRLRAYSNGVLLEAFHPPTLPTAPTELDTKGRPKKITVDQLEYLVEGQYDQATLQTMAEIIYQEQAREELTGELETRDMTDADGAEVLSLQNGDRLRFDLSPSLTNSIQGQSPTEAAAALVNPLTQVTPLGPVTAAQLVDAWGLAHARTDFYVQEAEHSLDNRTGYQLRVRFSEFEVD
jgi:hypothetical protein